MKNITLSVDEHVLAEVRRCASKHNTTVNGLVRDDLTRLAGQELAGQELAGQEESRESP